ncbi:NAD(P)-binding protein [Aspergillus costaricaensis CBS 115574]|uniref:NAD(P)-binding protein n=1 Tax=Aspergillus costaricaensis CBS 115574 TaxID=1448317 RepID=A0ACD1IEE4_9EURO|nr:NAD(P)-binding protein [Aspergillus costaricaensis CBS 115574]RAK88387.1 NAD(P)-binding protein [Aspergillus costaricaensis CBS 115574]
MSTRYAAVHQNTKGPGDARPTALQIIQDQKLENQLSDKVILITGCSSGIGVETARALFTTGATLFLTVRDVEKARSTLGDIVDSPRVYLLHLDLNSLDSVRACVQVFKSQSKTLNILIENAGVMACPEGRTVDGFETQFGCNHLAHFLLFYLLKPILLASSTPGFNSRVVIVSSAAHRYASVNFNNISRKGEYEPWKAYGQSKTASIWTANEIERQYGSQGLHTFSLHPGGIRTDLQRHVSHEQRAAWDSDKELANYWKSPEQGAATTVWGAVARELENQGGKYLDNCQIAGLYDPSTGPRGPGYASWAFDVEGQSRLWAETLKILELKDD